MVKRRWPDLIVTLRSVLGLFAAVALLGFTFLDTAVAGDLGLAMDSDNPHPRVDRVRYTLTGFKYLHGGLVLTGPHRSLPLTLSWLALTALLMWVFWRRWKLPSARRALRVSVVSLALVVGVGGPTLLVATERHNFILQPTLDLQRPVSMTSASALTLHLWRCGRWVKDQGCAQHWTPWPKAWSLRRKPNSSSRWDAIWPRGTCSPGHGPPQTPSGSKRLAHLHPDARQVQGALLARRSSNGQDRSRRP